MWQTMSVTTCPIRGVVLLLAHDMVASRAWTRAWVPKAVPIHIAIFERGVNSLPESLMFETWEIHGCLAGRLVHC